MPKRGKIMREEELKRIIAKSRKNQESRIKKKGYGREEEGPKKGGGSRGISSWFRR